MKVLRKRIEKLDQRAAARASLKRVRRVVVLGAELWEDAYRRAYREEPSDGCFVIVRPIVAPSIEAPAHG